MAEVKGSGAETSTAANSTGLETEAVNMVLATAKGKIALSLTVLAIIEGKQVHFHEFGYWGKECKARITPGSSQVQDKENTVGISLSWWVL